MKILGWFVTVVVVSVLAYIWHGWVLTILWTWFCVPVFNLPQLSLGPAIGVSLLVGYLTHQQLPRDDAPWKKQFIHNLSVVIVRPAVALGIGWIIKATI